MRIGFEFEAAKPKGEATEDEPYAESMRGNRKLLSNPSTDQKKVRRAQQRKSSRANVRPEENLMNFRQQESALLRAMASAKSLREQAVLAEELDKIRNAHTAAQQEEKDVSWADTVIRDTLTPVMSATASTTNSDWISDVEESMSTQAAGNPHSHMLAEASVWYNRVSPEVKADREEFSEQARGMARKLAGKYGEQAPAAARAFLDYSDFLLQREAASSLDQVQEIRDAKDNPKTTPLPEDTFDTFADPLAPGNEAGYPSTRAPLIQEILSDGGEGGGRPSEHTEGEDLSGHYGPPPTKSASLNGVDEDPFGFIASRSVALSYTGSLDDWRERLAKEAGGSAASPNDAPPPKDPQKCQKCGNDFTAPPNVHSGYCGKCRDVGKKDKGSFKVQDKNKYDIRAGDSKKATKEGATRPGPFESDKPGNDHRCVHGVVWGDRTDIQGRDGVKKCDQCEKADPNPKTSRYELVGRYIVEGASSLMPAGPAIADNKDNPVNQGWDAADTDPAFPNVALPERMTTGAEGGDGYPARHVETPARQLGADVKVSKKDADGDELPDRRTKKQRKDDAGAYDPGEEDDEKKTAALFSEIQRFADMYGASDTEHKTVGDNRDGLNEEHNDRPKKAKDVSDKGDMPNGAKDPKHSGGTGKPSAHKTAIGGEPGPQNPDEPGGSPAPNAPAGAPGASPAPEGPPGGGSGPAPAGGDTGAANMPQVSSSKDYRKAFRFAATWTPKNPLVAVGSAEFEDGLYQGIKENSRENRAAWVAKHRDQSERFPYLAERLYRHAKKTAMLKSAATDTDLNTVAPASHPSESGSTPLSGPGRTPPLAGRDTSEQTTGSPAPYNGAPPYGKPVVPGAPQNPPASGPDDAPVRQKSLYDTPGRQNTNPQTPSLTSQQLAFRQRVQASLLTETEME